MTKGMFMAGKKYKFCFRITVIKGVEYLQQTQIFFSLYICNLMVTPLIFQTQII